MRKSVSESYIQKHVCNYARKNGWIVFKFASPAQKGVPDCLFIKSGRVLFVEFKKPGAKPTKLQAHTHEIMRGAGARVYVIDDVVEGKELFND